MKNLSEKKCVPCTTDTPPLKGKEVKDLLEELGGGWQTVDERHLEKTYRFKNFREALDFVNDVGHIAEDEGHHPDLFLSWGQVKIQLWTHKIGGLSKNDFVMAAKCDAAHIGRFG